MEFQDSISVCQNLCLKVLESFSIYVCCDFIIDDELVLISSINWNYNSPTNNREAGLLIESEQAAEYYTNVFNYDWEGVVLDNTASAAVGFDIRIILAGAIIAGLVVLYIWRRRH